MEAPPSAGKLIAYAALCAIVSVVPLVQGWQAASDALQANSVQVGEFGRGGQVIWQETYSRTCVPTMFFLNLGHDLVPGVFMLILSITFLLRASVVAVGGPDAIAVGVLGRVWIALFVVNTVLGLYWLFLSVGPPRTSAPCAIGVGK